MMAVERACFDDLRYSRDIVLFMLSDEDFSSFLAEERGVIGSACVHVSGANAHLVSIGVVPEHRRRGVAAALLSAAEEEARSRGADRMALQVSVLNVPAMNMYLRRGYITECILRDYYGPGKDAILMDRAL
jgi:ribosomal-protein-alanine N-acetyltransferase